MSRSLGKRIRLRLQTGLQLKKT